MYLNSLLFPFAGRLLQRNVHTSCVLSDVSVVGEKTRSNPDPDLLRRPEDSSGSKALTISIAMKAYLERAKQHHEFMREKREEYELGKRHLANIMGWNPETITQDNIDEAIRYLLPSGLFEPLARPMMKPPEEVYPKQKAAAFDIQGRPFNSFFYTTKPIYYEYLHDIHAAFISLNKFEDSMLAQGILNPPKEGKIDLLGSQWFTYDEVKRETMEKMTEKEYQYLISTLERLAEHPYSARVKDIFIRYRKKMISVTSQTTVPPLTIDEATGRPFAEHEGKVLQ